MDLAIEILNKEIERREILLAVENNVLIQNDMSNEIGVLKDSVKNLALYGVVVPKGTFCEFCKEVPTREQGMLCSECLIDIQNC
tara:strand:+ start:1651 stop:1902 length:252 start_codon:yes stop_codon:yes gene_type:complete